LVAFFGSADAIFQRPWPNLFTGSDLGRFFWLGIFSRCDISAKIMAMDAHPPPAQGIGAFAAARHRPAYVVRLNRRAGVCMVAH
jgi:hypothetical protein